MTMVFSTTLRTALAQAIVTALGANATAELWDGTRPASLGSPAGAKKATLTFGSTAVTDANGGTAGGVASGVVTFGGVTQSNGSHVAGTPTFVRFKTSGGTVVIDVDVGGSLTFTGAVANGQNVTWTGVTLTMGNVGP
jgi:hypothetical protein